MIDWPLAELVPHAGDMILLDQVLEVGAEHIRTSLTVRPGGLFNRTDGSLPAWVGIELMAQTVAAFAGCQARAAGLPVQLGFLLGTRKFTCNVEHFAAHEPLQILATRSLQDDTGMAIFDCQLSGKRILAEARLTVYCPPEAGLYLAEPAHNENAQGGTP